VTSDDVKSSVEKIKTFFLEKKTGGLWELFKDFIVKITAFSTDKENIEEAIQIQWDFNNYVTDDLKVKEAFEILQTDPEFANLISIHREIIEENPRHHSSIITLYSLLNIRKDYKPIIEIFESVVAANPDNDQYLFLMGDELRKAEEFQKALPFFEKLAIKHPAYYRILAFAAYCYDKTGDLVKAEEYYKKAINNTPEKELLYSLLSNVYEKAGQQEKIIELLTNAEKQFPQMPSFKKMLADAFMKNKQYEESLKWYDESLKFKDYQERYISLNGKGLALSRMGRIQEAIACINEAIKIKPDSRHAYLDKADILEKTGRIDEAIETIHKATELNPDYSFAYYSFALLKEKKGELDEALNYFQSALEQYPENYWFKFDYGKLLEKFKGKQAAYNFLIKSALNKNLNVPDELAESIWNLSHSLSYYEGVYKVYKKKYEEEFPKLPEEKKYEKSTILFRLGYAAIKTERLMEAIDHFRKCIDIDPLEVSAWQNLAYCYYKVNNTDAAINAAADGVRENPKSPLSYEIYRSYSFRHDKTDQAEKLFKELAEEFPENYLPVQFIAFAKQAKYQYEDALFFMDKALKIAIANPGDYEFLNKSQSTNAESANVHLM
jgi:tetratricopeptide (TPR) repeat protein